MDRRKKLLVYNNYGVTLLQKAAAAKARILALPGLEAFYAPYIPGLTQPFVGTTNASSWPDSSGKGRDATQASGVAQPGIPGNGSLVGNGTTQFLSVTFGPIAQPYAIFTRQKLLAAPAAQGRYTGSPSNGIGIFETSGNTFPAFYAGTPLAQTPISMLGNYGTIVGIANGANSSIQVDQNTPVVGAGGSLGLDGFTLFSNGPTQFLNSQCAGSIILSGNPTAQTILQVQADMKTLADAAGIT